MFADLPFVTTPDRGQVPISRVTGHVFDPRGDKSHLDGEPDNQDLA